MSENTLRTLSPRFLLLTEETAPISTFLTCYLFIQDGFQERCRIKGKGGITRQPNATPGTLLSGKRKLVALPEVAQAAAHLLDSQTANQLVCL